MNNSDVIAVTSVFVAAMSFCVAIWQGMETRRHNKLSVKPSLGCVVRLFSDEPITVVLENHGLGPALIKSIVITAGGDTYACAGGGFSRLSVLLEQRFGAHSDHYFMDGDAPLRAEGHISLLSVDANKQSAESLLEFAKTGFIEVAYESMYGEKFRYAKRLVPVLEQ